MASQCRVELFGGLRVDLGGRCIDRFRTQKTALLLGWLAYHLDRTHPREVLSELLWPWARPESGRQSLSTALTSLRHQLEPPGVAPGTVLKADRFTVQLAPEAVSTDVATFHAALRAAERTESTTDRIRHLTAAVELHCGPLLHGYYEDWVVAEQERIAEQCVQALLALIHALEQAGDGQRAVDYARRAVACDPLREDTRTELIRLLIVARQPQAALEHCREFEQLLRAELDAEPSPGLQRLAQRLATVHDQPIADVEAWLAQPELRAAPRARRRWPTGTVTFLATGLEDAEALRESVGDALDEALAAHHRLLRKAVREHDGHDVRALGDGLMAAFGRATAAAKCAADAQRALAQGPWPAGMDGLPVRMALHTDEVELVGSEYRGPAPQHALRVLAAAHGGQVLCSEATAGMLQRRRDDGLQLVDLGLYMLGDDHRAERLAQLSTADSEPQQFPPPNAPQPYGSRLPLMLTRFFGRERELAWLSERLTRADTRLVTLTGPGGTGKSRLALEAARALLPEFAGAVWFVPLQQLSDPKLIPATIAEAMEIPRAPQLDPFDQAVAVLSRQRSLLVLDNFEQLVDEGALIVRTLLERAPTVTCLVTSRQTLDLSGEVECFVEPLPLPDTDDAPAELIECASVALLVDRAQAARPDFQVTPRNVRAVGELCHRLEGIPLALELAGARAQVLTPAQMLAQLERRFEFLEGRKRDVPDRHRTLRAAIDWSYQALPPELQRFFRGLCVFRGGWTVEAAAQVCDEPEALAALERLRERSMVLLSRPADASDGPRFRLLETLREYAQEQTTADELAALRSRHARFFLQFAETATPMLDGREQVAWLSRLEIEHDNIRAALACSLEADGCGEMALQLAAAMWRFWEIRGYLAQGCEWLGAALAAQPGPSAVSVRALNGLGRLLQMQGDCERAGDYHEQALAIARDLDDQPGIAASFEGLGSAAWRQGEHGLAREHLTEALARAGALGDRAMMACVHNLFGMIDIYQSDYAAARTHLEAALAINRELGNRASEADNLGNLAFVAGEVGDHEHAQAGWTRGLAIKRELGDQAGIAGTLCMLGNEVAHLGDMTAARAHLQESLTLSRELGEARWIAYSLFSLASLATAEGDYESARAFHAESLALAEQIGHRHGLIMLHRALGGLAVLEGDLQAAAAELAESLRIALEIEEPLGVAQALEGFAGLALAAEQSERAARLQGAAEAMREQLGTPLTPAEQPRHDGETAALRSALGDDAFEAAWAEGRGTSRDEAVAYALSCTGAEPPDGV